MLRMLENDPNWLAKVLWPPPTPLPRRMTTTLLPLHFNGVPRTQRPRRHTNKELTTRTKEVINRIFISMSSTWCLVSERLKSFPNINVGGKEAIQQEGQRLVSIFMTVVTMVALVTTTGRVLNETLVLISEIIGAPGTTHKKRSESRQVNRSM